MEGYHGRNWRRIEYQARGCPHFHVLQSIGSASSSNSEVDLETVYEEIHQDMVILE